MSTKAVNFRLTETEVGYLEGLAKLLRRSRTDVVRGALDAFRQLVVAAYAEGDETFRELHARYAVGLLVVELERDADGQPAVTLRIDGDTPDDFEAAAIIPPAGDHAFIVLDFVEGRDAAARQEALESKLRLAAHSNIIGGLVLGRLPWPPEPGQGIVRRIGAIGPPIPAETRELLEPVA